MMDRNHHEDGPLVRRLGTLVTEVRALEDHCRVPVTSTLDWFDLAAATDDEVAVWPRAAMDDGHLVGWIALGVSRGPVVSVRGLGYGLVDRFQPLLRRPADAVALAGVVARSLERLPRPWRFELEQLAVDDPLVPALLDELTLAERLPGDGCPVVEVAGAGSDTLGSRNWRKQIRQAANRVDRAGSHQQVELVTDPAELLGLLPRLAAVHVAREHDQDRRSELEDDRHRRFWRGTLLRLAAEDRVRCWVLRIDGEIAAYDIGLVDGDVLRNWDGRFDPTFDDFWPGKQLQAAVVRHGADNGYRRVDLLRGVAPHKLRLADTVDEHVAIRAWSDPATRSFDVGRSRVRARARRLRDDHDVLDRGWRVVKRRLVLGSHSPSSITPG